MRDVTGGVSDNARFAYTFDKTVVWNPPRTKVLSVKRLLRVFGTDGRELWSSAEADARDGLAPLLMSRDGETMLALLRGDKGWTASVRDYLGAPIIEAGPFERVEAAVLTGNGRYAMIRWRVPDKSATHTFLDVKNKVRKDIPSERFLLGSGTLDEGGKAWSGKKLVFDFNAVPATK